MARIIPFNHPLTFVAGRVAAPLDAGNTVIMKPSEHTSLSALRWAELIEDVVPDGLIQIITGRGGTTGDALVSIPTFDAWRRGVSELGAGNAGSSRQVGG